ncbi:MAG TPA: J domain-containing protein [Acidimicrobiales bacterium]|nr:J domain-containing protein [Acidimicrobiales bacterium]
MSHYETLGVDRDADTETIRVNYRRLARTRHPDRLGADASPEQVSEAEDMMSRLNEAWRVLGDPESRAAYDRTLDGGRRSAGPGRAGDGSAPAASGETDGSGAPAPGPERREPEEQGAAVVGVARLLVRFAPPWFVFSFTVLVVAAVMESEPLRALALFGLLASLVMFMIAPLLVMGSTRTRGDPPPDGSRAAHDD